MNGDRKRSRAGRLAERGQEAGLDREDLLGIYRNMLITRGIEERGHILYKQGKIPGLVLHGPRQRGSRRSASRRRWARRTSARRSTATWASTSPAASSPGGSSRSTWAAPTGRRRAATATCTWPTRSSGLIAMVSHLPAMLPVAVGCALAFRIREEKRVAVAWFGEGASARGDTHEGMNFAGVRRLPGRVHLRQQPVGLLDADASRIRGRARSPIAPRPTASRASSSTAPTCSPSTARRSARSRRRARAAGRR